MPGDGNVSISLKSSSWLQGFWSGREMGQQVDVYSSLGPVARSVVNVRGAHPAQPGWGQQGFLQEGQPPELSLEE